MIQIAALFALMLALPFPAPSSQSLKADLVLRNARIWTGEASMPWAQAVAIRGNRIVAVGENSRMSALVGERTEIIEASGKLALPGFNDAHTHFLSGSLGLFEVDLTGAKNLGEIRQRVHDYAREHPRQTWITGAGWEYSVFPDKRLPTRADLDAAVADRPVYLRAYDGHTGWANSKALEMAGITAKSRFQGYGELVVDRRTGEPTGALKESAQGLVRAAIPAPSRETQLAALRAGLQLAASLGITSLQNASGNPEELRLYQELRDRGELTARVSMAMSISQATSEGDLRKFASHLASSPGALLRTKAVKILLDGVIESHTAAMLEPYSDNAPTSGTPSMPANALNRLVAAADKMGLQIYIHAIGDRAVRMALDAYEAARKMNGAHDARFRIEHIETISASDIPRFAELGVIASMEPIHADPGTNDVWEPAVGPERAQRAFAWRALEKAGARLVFSSDWPATISVDPIRGIHNAVNRRTIDGLPPEGWIPEQRISVESAVRAYTQGGAFASFEENVKGTIAEGKLADIVLLSQDVFKIEPMQIYRTKVALTIFDGKVLHRKAGS